MAIQKLLSFESFHNYSFEFYAVLSNNILKQTTF